MTKQERQGWTIVASLFVTLFLIFGSGYDTFSIFLSPLLKHFKWSRAQASELQAALAISAGLSAPLIGWLLDRIEARVVMVTGAVVSGAAFLFASRVDSFGPMLAAYAVLGVGLGAATLLPASLVIANWFGARRGLAMGVAFAGTSLGGAGMALVASWAITRGGWRAGYVTLAIPMIAIVVPVVLLLVRTRPAQSGAGAASMASAADSLPGLELSQAVRTRSFWMIVLAQFLYASVAAGMVAHLATHLIDLGYKPAIAASVISLAFLFTSAGKLVMGVIADRVSAKNALAANFVLAGIGMVLIFGIQHSAILVPFVIVSGLTLGAPLVLVPMVTVESLGLKRFGTIGGVAGIANTVGAALGPVITGRIYDISGSYTLAFEFFVAMCIAGALISMACQPLEVEEARLRRTRIAEAAA